MKGETEMPTRQIKKMKKYILLLSTVIALGALTSCNKKTEISLNIACPSGAPAVALYNMYKNANVEINADANNVIGYLSTDSNKDIVIAPTNALVAVVKKNAPFKIAATVTFGNFYIASTGNDDNGTMDKSDYVVLFQQNGLPDKIFKYVYGTDFDNLHYVTAASDANKCLISGINASDNNNIVDYVLVPQPALTTGLSKNANASLYADVQSDYKIKSNGLEITQASIFVRDSADKTQVNAFLNQIEEDIKNLLKKPSLIEDALKGLEDEQAQAKFGANATMLKTVLSNNSLGLGFKYALTNKASIDNFLISLNFSNEETSENVYYQ